MNIIEITGDALAYLRQAFTEGDTAAVHTVRVATETDDPGYVKVKVNEGIWTHPLSLTHSEISTGEFTSQEATSR